MRPTGLAVCAWHHGDNYMGILYGLVWVFRKRSKKKTMRLIRLPDALVLERRVSHGICATCSVRVLRETEEACKRRGIIPVQMEHLTT